ncbi:MAG: ribonuclease HII [Coriobacteriales bacterium]|nr:ribonuclease HII [Coriobacteriales bacterium]
MTKSVRQLKKEEKTRQLYKEMSSFSINGAVIGLDEVGRGCVAGPLCIGAVVLPSSPQIVGLDDSKKISAKNRELLAKEIKTTAIAYSTVFVSNQVIDNEGMAFALRLAFSNALRACEKKLKEETGQCASVVLIDGNRLEIDNREINILQGDTKVACISAASIIAKVTRDAYMVDQSQNYPNYSFEKHKGYGTAQHLEAIKEFGICDLHRRSFLSKYIS